MHDRVADKHNFNNVRGRDSPLTRRRGNELANHLARRPGHFSGAILVQHGVRDSTHQVLAEANLGVHPPDRGNNFTGFEVSQVNRNRRRTQINSSTIEFIDIARPQPDNSTVAAHGDGRQVVAELEALAQIGNELDAGNEFEVGKVLTQSLLQALPASLGAVHGGLVDGDPGDFEIEVDRDVAAVSGFADDLAVNLTLGRHVDDDIALNRARAP